jgi:hypothetical protein
MKAIVRVAKSDNFLLFVAVAWAITTSAFLLVK